jgi:AcrR family transcriptional regulator
MTQHEPETPLLDRRVQRTRRQLRDALIGLILERGWDHVSVREVCARADVGRSTFYVHFADKEELLLSGFDELYESLDALRRSGAGSFRFIDALVEHAAANRQLHAAIIGRQSGQHAMRRFRDVVLRLVEAELASLGFELPLHAAAARYVSGGFVELMSAWLDRPSSKDAGGVVSTFRQFTAGVLSVLPHGAGEALASRSQSRQASRSR